MHANGQTSRETLTEYIESVIEGDHEHWGAASDELVRVVGGAGAKVERLAVDDHEDRQLGLGRRRRRRRCCRRDGCQVAIVVKGEERMLVVARF